MGTKPKPDREKSLPDANETIVSPEDKTITEDGLDLDDEMPQALERGTSVGRYLVAEMIGRGGMGVVYKAFDPDLNRPVALKLLRVKSGEGSTSGGGSTSPNRTRLLREGQALAQLSHPNVVTVFDVGSHEESVFIAMEYVDGQTLKQWLLQEDRSQPEILELLKAAGQGLSAAHDSGIIHRDFKPGNVMIGKNGRVRVLDFGLARAAGSANDDEPALADSGEESGSLTDSQELLLNAEGGVESSEYFSGLLSSSVTQTGAFLGTPSYMSPEQHHGKSVDALSDQFSFAVVLFEALYGQRPFGGKTYGAFVRTVTQGRIRAPADKRRVPKWIARVIFQGLKPKPARRHASMRHLLEELEKDPAIAAAKKRAARIRVLVMAAFLLLVPLAGFGIWYGATQGVRRCQGASEQLRGVWDSEVKKTIETAFAQTGRHYAEDTFVRVERLLDQRSQAWTAMWTEACEATHVQGKQSDKMLDLRMRCLDRKLGAVRALTHLFATKADGKIVDKAVQAALGLTGLERCADTAALSAAFPPPEDPALQAKVKSQQAKLAEARALSRAGKYPDALTIVQEMLPAVEAAGYLPLLAETKAEHADLLSRIGRNQEAAEGLEKAMLVSAQAKHDLVMARAATRYLYVVGYQQGFYAEGLKLFPFVESALSRAGAEPALYARALNIMGILYERLGRYQESVDYEGRALAIREQALGADHPFVAYSFNNLGIVAMREGKYDLAIEHLNRAVAIRERALGPQHPDVAVTLNNMGIVRERMGDYEGALKVLQRVQNIWTSALGPEAPVLSHALNNLGNVYKSKGDFLIALPYYQKALAIWQETLGAHHQSLAHPLTGIGECKLLAGQYAAAVPVLEKALRIRESGSIDAKLLGETRFALARALDGLGKDRKRAHRLATQALESFRNSLGGYWQKKRAQAEAWLQSRN